tara:strand:+ start:16346 stop:16825 length:480 start_codon:yes stop_codon:yes gene_type:complete
MNNEESKSKASELASPHLKKTRENSQTNSNELAAKIKTSMPSWAASLGVAAMLIIALQLTFVFQPTQESTLDTELLSSIPNAITEPHWLLQLAFEPTAKWSEITETLESVGGVITDGPSSMGLIRAVIPKENTRFKESQALLEWLNAQASVVHVALDED